MVWHVNTALALDDVSFIDYQTGMTISLKEARIAAGLSQDELAELAGTSQPQIGRLEKGTRKLSKEWAERLAPLLKRRAVDLMFFHGDAQVAVIEAKQSSAMSGNFDNTMEAAQGTYRPVPDFFGERDFKIFSAVEGGPGEMVVDNEPIEVVQRPWYMRDVRDGFGVVVTGESMMPKYDPGTVVVANPKLPPLRGKPAIFLQDKTGGDFKATIKIFVGQTAEQWHVEQFNPAKNFKLPREIWRLAYRVVGTYEGI